MLSSAKMSSHLRALAALDVCSDVALDAMLASANRCYISKSNTPLLTFSKASIGSREKANHGSAVHASHLTPPERMMAIAAKPPPQPHSNIKVFTKCICSSTTPPHEKSWHLADQQHALPSRPPSRIMQNAELPCTTLLHVSLLSYHRGAHD